MYLLSFGANPQQNFIKRGGGKTQLLLRKFVFFSDDMDEAENIFNAFLGPQVFAGVSIILRYIQGVKKTKQYKQRAKAEKGGKVVIQRMYLYKLSSLWEQVQQSPALLQF